MSTEENKALVRRYWEEVWNQGDLDLIEELFAPDFFEEQKYFISRTLQAFSESHVTIDDMLADGDKVITRYTWRAVHSKVWDLELEGISMAVPPTGQAIWDRGITIFCIANGRITKYWSEWTKLELAQQLGAIATS